MNYQTLLNANGKPDEIWEEQLSKNLVLKFMRYDDGRIFVFDIKKQSNRFCRVEITPCILPCDPMWEYAFPSPPRDSYADMFAAS